MKVTYTINEYSGLHQYVFEFTDLDLQNADFSELDNAVLRQEPTCVADTALNVEIIARAIQRSQSP